MKNIIASKKIYIYGMVKLLLMASFGLLILTSCSFLSPVKPATSNQYVLNKIPANIPIKNTRSINLFVSTPNTAPMYNTKQMAYTIKPYQIAYFSQNSWAETPSDMLQPLLLQTLQNTHYFRAVSAPPSTGQFNYVLNTQILTLLQDFTHPMPLLVVAVRVQITKLSTNQVIATRQFTINQPILQRTPYAGVYAANDAVAKILREITLFCLEKI